MKTLPCQATMNLGFNGKPSVPGRTIIFSSRTLSHFHLPFARCRFCGLKGHEMFCEVERSYIEDGFNLYGLRTCVSNFSDCLDLILDRIGPDDSDDSHLTQSACTLYSLIHARYVITAHGLDAMYSKVRLILRVSRCCESSSYRMKGYCTYWSICKFYSLHVFNPPSSLVHRKGLWNMPIGTMRWADGSSGRSQGRSGRGYGKNILPQMFTSLSSTADPKQSDGEYIWRGRSCLWYHVSTFVSYDV